ncbi:undecaprenyl-diphosphate phosphatase [Ruegeria jejuensis]|uniref:undecaprenyl-diphosphate phosphatase n=1 Tax=Ruegeria jejuensis TaxID=3233338 RepID=UPI00355BD7EE
MTFLHIILVALIQGITEFLPVSSSGHLILLPKLTGMTDQGQFIDVAVHVGTLGAVILYFRRDVALALRGTPAALLGRLDAPGARLALGLMIATVPIILVGAILHFAGLSDALRSIKVIAWTMLGFGLVLYWADRTGGDVKATGDWTLRDAVVLGLWQVLALIPGTSRSGITITGARLLGYGREDGARLAMLMSIPTIAASGILLSADAAVSADAETIRNGVLAAGLSFLSALAALALMMRFLRSVSFTPYVVYRVALGLILLAIAYG